MLSLRLAIGELLAANLPLAQPTNELIVRLIAAPFSEDENLVVGDLTFATFTGSTALEVAVDDQQVAVDPVTSQQVVTLVEPLGGWRWETTDAVNLPETIYGAALLTSASAALLALHTLPTPIGLTAAGQEINLGALQFRINLSPMS